MPLLRFAAASAILAAVISTVGCASSDRPKEVPARAAEVDGGKGTVYWTAAGDDRVFVSDSNRKQLIYSGEMRTGQTIKVDARADKIVLDDITATKSDLLNHHTFKVYFDRTSNAAAQASQGTGKTVVTVDSRSGLTTIEQRQ